MRNICFYFQVHQPYRLRNYGFFEIGNSPFYFDEFQNRWIAKRVADKCYLPTNAVLLEQIRKHGNRFKVSFSFSGVCLEQMEKYTPEVIKSFQELVDTGCVEILSETYTHGLAALKSETEFKEQVAMHAQKIKELFGVTPGAFRNTELIYSNNIGRMVASMGYEIMLTEGAKHIMGWRSPNFVYRSAEVPQLKLLLKNFQLSDDIAFRFSQHTWTGFPLTAEKFVEWLKQIEPEQPCVNLFMDYETFGEHQWQETGIFDFMRFLPERILDAGMGFSTVSEQAQKSSPVDEIDVPYPISWADEERDLSAWLGNELQDDAFEQIYALESEVKDTKDEGLIHTWRSLQTSDHFYYMCTKWFSDGDVHKYFNPYDSPYQAYINYMNVLSDFRIRLREFKKR